MNKRGIQVVLFPTAGIVAGFVVAASPGMLGTWGSSAKRERFLSLLLFDLGFSLFFTLIFHGKTSHRDFPSVDKGKESLRGSQGLGG
jgi:hypothetical protein